MASPGRYDMAWNLNSGSNRIGTLRAILSSFSARQYEYEYTRGRFFRLFVQFRLSNFYASGDYRIVIF